MVERVARAINPIAWGYLNHNDDNPTRLRRRNHSVRLAKLAIKTMRDPTPEMLEAGKLYYTGHEAMLPELWRAMTANALGKEPEHVDAPTIPTVA